jgi:hypothetical protein
VQWNSQNKGKEVVMVNNNETTQKGRNVMKQ